LPVHRTVSISGTAKVSFRLRGTLTSRSDVPPAELDGINREIGLAVEHDSAGAVSATRAPLSPGTLTLTVEDEEPQPPEVLLQATVTTSRGETVEGQLIQAVQLPWLRIFDEIDRNPKFLHRFAQHPREFEEFIAATYALTGEYDDVTLTPRSRDGGRDVIVVKKGFGSIRILDQVKAHSPGHLVDANDVRALFGVLNLDHNASKGVITTTSDFAPGVFKEFDKAMPYRLQTKNGAQLVDWLKEIAAKRAR
jgi:restriction system protein